MSKVIIATHLYSTFPHTVTQRHTRPPTSLTLRSQPRTHSNSCMFQFIPQLSLILRLPLPSQEACLEESAPPYATNTTAFNLMPVPTPWRYLGGQVPDTIGWSPKQQVPKAALVPHLMSYLRRAAPRTQPV